ncbi:MAG: DUF448 domain-containing protein [Polyangiaceae bacterium]|nr:DUF448 domain-containing protein [Polyangiaceae bacterium]
MEQQHTASTASNARPKRVRERTCIGCWKPDASKNLLRLVLGPDNQVAFDLANHAVGRGAHVHPTAHCLQRAARTGLSRAFRKNIACDTAWLFEQLESAAERRLSGLLGSALRSGSAVIGRQFVDNELAKNQIELVMLACDAGDSLSPSLTRAVTDGRVVTWGSMIKLGAALGRSDVVVVAIRDPSLGNAIAEVCRIADSVRSRSEVR